MASMKTVSVLMRCDPAALDAKEPRRARVLKKIVEVDADRAVLKNINSLLELLLQSMGGSSADVKDDDSEWGKS